ncbi:YihY/virulence factor BrkB family protein [Mobilicoccus massiliensis]|uniref:YihY/virulence factor BrkB family protein n=1 Tax=Mobilicoccus massiliensis TaxID=1522310 RepID=UPI000694FB2C|nr:YihY/virulence factor BrkB family protein [Mobilicoccus massiliensis]
MATASSDNEIRAHDDPDHDGEESTPKKAVGTIMTSRPMRAFQRFGKARGGLLAGGIAYTALFSIVSALTIAWTVFMSTLGGDPGLRGQVIKAVNTTLPGILDDGSGQGMIDPDTLVLDSAINPASVIAALVLLWSAVGMMSNIRSTVQAMFGMVAPADNFVIAKLRDLLGFIVMALGIVLSALLGTAASTMGATVMQWIGLGDNPVVGFLVRILGLLVAAAVAACTFAFLFRVTAAVRPLAKDLWMGAAIGGVAVQVVLNVSTLLVAKVADNPLLAASASLGALLLIVNILSQVLMLVAAFTANPPAPDKVESPQEVHFKETPNFVTLSDRRTLEWKHQDVTGQIDVDETLRPGYRAPKGGDRRPGVGDVRPDGQPIGGVLVSPWSLRSTMRKARKHERKAVELRARLGQRPRIDAAEQAYWRRRGIRGRFKVTR